MLKRLLLLLLVCMAAVNSGAQTSVREANLKAAFIYNFTKYIEWDSSNYANDFVIGVIGSSPVTSALMEIARTNQAKNKKIVIRVFNKPEDISFCHILFIPQKIPYPLSSVLAKVGKGTLTISEEPGFAKQGTAFNFKITNDKLKFEVNLAKLYSAGLKAGSQLLKLAEIVDE
ncbi:MAG TPA: YfiR family protein [Chitinophagaceae bacterium]|nr:YfiR family protein [Chitinophagaceae bacterium]